MADCRRQLEACHMHLEKVLDGIGKKRTWKADKAVQILIADYEKVSLGRYSSFALLPWISVFYKAKAHP